MGCPIPNCPACLSNLLAETVMPYMLAEDPTQRIWNSIIHNAWRKIGEIKDPMFRDMVYEELVCKLPKGGR